MKIEVYSQPNCPPCEWVKNLLNEKQISYIEYDITVDSQAKKRLIFDYDCFSTPTIIIDNENVVTGSDVSKLDELL